MRTALIASAFVASAGAASAGDMTIRPRADGIQVVYAYGQPEMWSNKDRGQVSILPVESVWGDRDRLEFLLAVTNETDQPVSITLENIRVVDDQGRPVRVFSADELERMADRSARNSRLWSRFGAALASSGGGYSTTHGSFSGSASNMYGNQVHTSGSYTEQTYNPAAAALASRAARENLEASLGAAEGRRLQQRTRAQAVGFSPATINPGARYFSGITLDRLDRRAQAVFVEVDFAGETHRIAMDLVR